MARSCAEEPRARCTFRRTALNKHALNFEQYPCRFLNADCESLFVIPTDELQSISLESAAFFSLGGSSFESQESLESQFRESVQSVGSGSQFGESVQKVSSDGQTGQIMATSFQFSPNCSVFRC